MRKEKSMKSMKKMLALVIAMVMIVGTMNMAAFAAPGDLNSQGTITVSGLNDGTKETVKYFKVLEWDQAGATIANGGWKFTTAFAGVDGAADKLQEILNGGISGDTAAALAKLATGDGITSPAGSISGKTWSAGTTAAPVDPGLYMVVISTTEPGILYNPVFVASNWYATGATEPTENSFAIVKDQLSYSDNAYAKMSSLFIDKTAAGHTSADTDHPNNDADANTTDVGDVLDFTVKTKIPVFSDAYTNPVFKVKDTLEGLTLDQTSIKVYPAATATGTPLVENTDYTLEKSASGYTVTFLKAYLQSATFPAAGQDITITYSAEVTDTALKTVNQDKNTVDLIYSTNPSDTTGGGRLRDKTNHFTFSIDADILGGSGTGDSSQELIKVGVSADGTPIEELKKTDYHYTATHSALEGAEFTLYKADGETVYTNDVFNGTVKSDADGRINIKGLDVGTYVLKETKAPAGYIKQAAPITITISAVVKTDKTIVEEVDGVECTYITNYLESYSVAFDDGTNSASTSYTITNDSVGTSDTAVSVTRTGNDQEVKNTKGVELPSTGGMGTTLFYIIGAVLVLGAGILLVTRRRMSAN